MGLNQERLQAALKLVKSNLPLIKDFTNNSEDNIDFNIEFNVQIFEQLESTNKTLWQLVEQGAPSGTVVIAERQTAGRGQWGREWNSPLGGLYLSIALSPHLPVTKSFQLTLASAWGIATILRSYHVPVLIKWPNDLILNQRKLGGILTETKVQSQMITKAVVGVGINWENSVPPTGIALKTYQLDRQKNQMALPPPGGCSSLEMLAAITLWGIDSGIKYMRHESVEKLLSRYLAILANLGQRVMVAGQPGVITGVTAMGDLRVEVFPEEKPAPNNSTSPGMILSASLGTEAVTDGGTKAIALTESHSSPGAKSEILLKPGTISLGYDTFSRD